MGWNRYRAAVLSAAAAGWLASAGATAALAGPDKVPYKAVCTVGMVTDIVRQVAGERAEVVGILGTGVDPHLYKPTRNDVAAMQAADVVFYSGLMLEGKMADVLVKVARNGKAVYAVTELLDEKFLLEPPEFKGHYDPHVWMDVSAWSKAVEAVAKSLGEFDPDGAAYYDSNAQRKFCRSGRRGRPTSPRPVVGTHWRWIAP